MGQALEKGMVLVLSLWDDPSSAMRWLDSDEPLDLPMQTMGVHRGRCPREGISAAELEKSNSNAFVKYTDIRYGEVGSTHPGLPSDAVAKPERQPAPVTPPLARAGGGSAKPVVLATPPKLAAAGWELIEFKGKKYLRNRAKGQVMAVAKVDARLGPLGDAAAAPSVLLARACPAALAAAAALAAFAAFAGAGCRRRSARRRAAAAKPDEPLASYGYLQAQAADRALEVKA